MPIPKELQRLKRWLVWRMEARLNAAGEESPNKVPYYASGRRRYGTLDAAPDVANLVSFKAASAALAGGHYTGMGFALGDGVGGIDLDKCIDEHGVLADWAASIVEVLDSYTELSPSGRGLHIIVRCEPTLRALPANGSGVEFYSGKHYFTVTGQTTRERPVRELSQGGYGLLAVRHEPERDNVIALPRPAYASPSLWQYQKIEAVEMLKCIDPDATGRMDWLKIGMALHHASAGAEDAYALWHEWSAQGALYNPNDWPSQWNSFKDTHAKPVQFPSLVKRAQAGGYRKGAAQPQPERELPGALPKDFVLDDLDTMVIPETQWIVDGLIAPGLTLLAAPAKQGKSYWALQSCICVGAGVPFMGRATHPVRVTYFDLEEWHALLKERVDAIKKGHGLAGKKLSLVNVKLETGTGDKFLADLQQEYDRGSRYIVVDVFARVRNELDEDAKKNAFARDYAVVAKLADFALAHPDLALLVVHHGNKGKHDEWQNKISGSMGIAAASHANFYMARPDLRGMGDEDKEDALRYRVLHGVGKLVREQDLALEMMTDGGGWQVSAFKPWEISTTRKQKDVLFLLASEDRAFSSAEIASRMGMQGAAAKRLLWRMAKSGTIDSDGRGGDGYRLKRR